MITLEAYELSVEFIEKYVPWTELHVNFRLIIDTDPIYGMYGWEVVSD